MRDVFPYVMAIDVARYNNTILVGSNAPLSADALSDQSVDSCRTSPVREVADWSLDLRQHPRHRRPGGLVFTDDRPRSSWSSTR